MPPDQRVEGKYNDNPNEFFYSNKIFRAGDSALRTSSLGEARANEDGNTTKDDPAICPNCNSESFGYIMDGQRYEFENVQSNGKVKCDNCDGEFTPRELVMIADGYYTESKASESDVSFGTLSDYLAIDYSDGSDYCKICGKDLTHAKDNELLNHVNSHDDKTILEGESTDRFEADIENDQVVQKLPDDKRSFDVEAKLPRQMDFKTGGYAGKNEWGGDATLCEICGTKFNTYPEFLDHYQTHDEANGPEFYESKASEKGEWDWLDKGADSKSVDYDEVEYKDDGVSDISIQNAEPKLKDQNAFLDNVNIGVESVDYVYKTKAYEAMEKTYIPVSETFEEDYEEFEDSDEAMIKETITLRKLTGYGDDAIARELNINYGVSHEEALEKVYSVEVSTNDRVSQTFFGKMYKECTESEKDELRMYSGSD